MREGGDRGVTAGGRCSARNEREEIVLWSGFDQYWDGLKVGLRFGEFYSSCPNLPEKVSQLGDHILAYLSLYYSNQVIQN